MDGPASRNWEEYWRAVQASLWAITSAYLLKCGACALDDIRADALVRVFFARTVLPEIADERRRFLYSRVRYAERDLHSRGRGSAADRFDEYEFPDARARIGWRLENEDFVAHLRDLSLTAPERTILERMIAGESGSSAAIARSLGIGRKKAATLLSGLRRKVHASLGRESDVRS